MDNGHSQKVKMGGYITINISHNFLKLGQMSDIKKKNSTFNNSTLTEHGKSLLKKCQNVN